jgi:hypothetical protein
MVNKFLIMSFLKILFISLVLIISFFKCASKTENDNESDQVVVDKIVSKKGNELYLKRFSSGITFDNEFIVLSVNSSMILDSTTDYIYPTTNVFYKISKLQDSVYIFSSVVSNTPSHFKSSMVIVQKELENSDLMDLMGYDKYKKVGLKMIK